MMKIKNLCLLVILLVSGISGACDDVKFGIKPSSPATLNLFSLSENSKLRSLASKEQLLDIKIDYIDGFYEIRIYREGKEILKDLSESKPVVISNTDGSELAYMYDLGGKRSRLIKNGVVDDSKVSKLSSYKLVDGKLVGIPNKEAMERNKYFLCQTERYGGWNTSISFTPSSCLEGFSNISDEEGTQKVMDLIILHGADLNLGHVGRLTKKNKAYMPLTTAAQNKDLKRMRIFLFYGANPNNNRSDQPVGIAVARAGLEGGFDLLKKYGYDFKSSSAAKAVFDAVAIGNEDQAKELVINGADISVRKGSASPFYRAAALYASYSREDSLDIAKFLLQNGANVNVVNDKENGCGHLAAKKRKLRLLKLCAEYGYNFQMGDWLSRTPLDFAKEYHPDWQEGINFLKSYNDAP